MLLTVGWHPVLFFFFWEKGHKIVFPPCSVPHLEHHLHDCDSDSPNLIETPGESMALCFLGGFSSTTSCASPSYNDIESFFKLALDLSESGEDSRCNATSCTQFPYVRSISQFSWSFVTIVYIDLAWELSITFVSLWSYVETLSLGVFFVSGDLGVISFCPHTSSRTKK